VVVAPHGAGLTGPRMSDAQLPFTRPAKLVAFGVDDDGVDARQRERRQAWFGRGRRGNRRNANATGLGLPPGVDDRAPLLADDIEVPAPGLGVDGLAHRAEHTYTAAIVSPHGIVAVGGESTNSRRCGVEDAHAMTRHQIPIACWCRVI